MGQNVSHRIDILGDHGLQAARCEQAGQGCVPLVGLGVAHSGVVLELAPPVFPPGSWVSQELGQLNGTHLLPDTLGTPEIPDTALRADPGAGEGDCAAAAPNPDGELCNVRRKLGFH
jgi:hypothetical protein